MVSCHRSRALTKTEVKYILDKQSHCVEMNQETSTEAPNVGTMQRIKESLLGKEMEAKEKNNSKKWADSWSRMIAVELAVALRSGILSRKSTVSNQFVFLFIAWLTL